ncbi:MAG: rRNA pseudouridine synthase [Lachnospiraceae bacterium]|nr:rRNA pseudouridine synthase [Lachnospiraceae bacterium]MBP5564152.1 rRNA pseudouridine synthase [Lachnospiraceae bacterium]
MSSIRLDKYLADMGVGSRRDVKSILKAGRVKVNSVIVTEAEAKIDIDADNVELDGKRIGYEEYRYYMLNKPAGVISATKDKLSDTVIEILKGENTKDLFPVGRLDKDSEGLLIISNDGKFAHNVLSPAKHVDKTYFVRLDKKPNEEEISRIENGIDIGDDKPCLPAKVEVISDDEAYITISEGRFHQVKRMFQAVGINVTYLKRISMGALKLDENLAPGEYKKLSKEEINEVFGG